MNLLPDLRPGSAPQEPRRPRFPFFHLHNVKERTPGASFEGGVMEVSTSEFWRTEPCFRFPGSRSALSISRQQWERQALGVVNGAGCIRGIFACQHPIFTFRRSPETENLRSKIALVSQWLASIVTAFPRRRLSDGGYIWMTILAVNTDSDVL